MFSIVGIFRDEGPYLHEWIAFHRLQGFDNFLLYNNGSSDSGEQVARACGAEVIDWPGELQQLPAYHDALRRLLPMSWAAFIDVDEYLWCPDGTPVVDKLITEYGDEIALGAPWQMFGSSGHLHKPAGLTIVNYLYREDAVNVHVKQILRVRKHYRFLDPHHTNAAYVRTDNSIVCNHYWTRSEEECRQKFERGRADFATRRTMSEFYDTFAALNKLYDPRLYHQHGRELDRIVYGL